MSGSLWVHIIVSIQRSATVNRGAQVYIPKLDVTGMHTRLCFRSPPHNRNKHDMVWLYMCMFTAHNRLHIICTKALTLIGLTCFSLRFTSITKLIKPQYFKYSFLCHTIYILLMSKPSVSC